MKVILILLIVILVIVIAFIRQNVVKGSYEPVIRKPYGKNAEFNNFINDDKYATAVRYYVQKHENEVWDRYMPKDTYVTNAILMLFTELNTQEAIDKLSTEHPDIPRETIAKMVKKSDKAAFSRRYEELQNNVSNVFDEIIANDHYRKIIIPIDSRLSEAHAIFIIFDPETLTFLLINPHYIQDDNDEFDIIKTLIEDDCEDYFGWKCNFVALKDYVSDTNYTCPVFQGSFDNDGFCYIWRFYLALLFATNPPDEYKKIINIYKGSKAWVQRQLQEFMFMIYKDFDIKVPNENENEKMKFSLRGSPYKKGSEVKLL